MTDKKEETTTTAAPAAATTTGGTETETKKSSTHKTLNYFPFRKSLFQNKDVSMKKVLKYGNKGIIRGLQWRKGWPVHRIRKFAGGFFPSGHRDHRKYNAVLRKQKATTIKKMEKTSSPRS